MSQTNGSLYEVTKLMAKPITSIRNAEPGETSFGLLKAAWPQMAVSARLSVIGLRLPELLAGLVGLEDAYWRSAKNYGFITWWAPHNLYRQVWHFLGGVVLFTLLNIILWAPIAILLVLIYSLQKELKDMRPKANAKSMLDFLFWSAGAFVGAYLCL